MTDTMTREADRPHVHDPEDLPDPEQLPELRIYSHSTLLYWWPVWVAGYVMALITLFMGGEIELDSVRNELFHQSAGPGIVFVVILLMVILFTNVKMRGIYSVVFGLVLTLITVLLAWSGLWDDIVTFVPRLSVHMNMGFYLVFSTALAVIWMLQFFVFDRMRYWRIRPGQLTEEQVIGGAEESYDARGMLFEQRSDDFFRHTILGLGAADLRLITSGARQASIEIPNVLFARRKIAAIQRLIAVKPDDLLEDPTD